MKQKVCVYIYIVKGMHAVGEGASLDEMGVLVGGLVVEGVGIVLISSKFETGLGLRLGPKSHAMSSMHSCGIRNCTHY